MIYYYDEARAGHETPDFSVDMIADTVGKHNGVRLTTMALTYPRYIHAQMMTHRVFSRNAQSSRAVPVAKMIERVKTSPVIPTHWGLNQRGMVASGEADEVRREQAISAWSDACSASVQAAQKLADLGIHKQAANRLLEPFATITAIYTATEWGNFFKLRIADDAQPEIRDLAIAMSQVMVQSDPVVAEYHLPYITREEYDWHSGKFMTLKKISSARCARVSYLTHTGERDIDREFELFQHLSDSGHWSPMEHAAHNTTGFENRANLRGWASCRYLLGF